jgi:hypothetical protein
MPGNNQQPDLFHDIARLAAATGGSPAAEPLVADARSIGF